MDTVAITRLADILEHQVTDKMFRMDYFMHKFNEGNFTAPEIAGKGMSLKCKSQGCIAGWAVAFLGDQDKSMRTNIDDEARVLLNLTNTEAYNLFYGKWSDRSDLAMVTRLEAVEELRRLARTRSV